MHSDVTLELPFTLTHPEPQEKVVCGMVTLPRPKPKSAKEMGTVKEGPQVTETAEPEPIVLRPSDVDTSSVHGLVLDRDLITFE